MNLQQLKQLIASGESERIEFKATTGQRKEAGKTVCAMLNGIGGFVLFGVADNGDLKGQQVAANTLEDIAAELKKIDPPAFPDIETISLENGLAVIVLSISGGAGLYAFDSRPYLRVGATTSIMPKSEYERRLIQRLHATHRWENEPVPAGVGLDDLDAAEIQRTVDAAIRLGRLDATVQRDIPSILRGLELLRDGKLLNAAVALYGNTDQLKILYPQFGIRLGRFRGINRLADFADNRQYWGNIFSLLRRGESFLMDHVPIAGRVISGKMIREDQPWYPPRATREALANALCHRDYTCAGGAVAVAMYDDHLEIVNPGMLPFGITPAKLVVPHESKPWNPIIAGTLYRAGVIEKWGSGTLNILDWCRENHNPPPTWYEQAGSVYANFLPAVLPEIQGIGQTTPQVTPQVTLQVTPQVKKLLLAMTGEETRQELMTQIGLKDRAHFFTDYLQPALEAGLIEMTIPDKPNSSNQRYRLTPKGIQSQYTV